MKTEIPYKQSIGKTIEAFVVDGAEMVIAFTDGTCTVLEVSGDLDAYARIEQSDIKYANRPMLVTAGVMTRDEYDTETAQQKREIDERNAMRERQEYERLRKLYEGKVV